MVVKCVPFEGHNNTTIHMQFKLWYPDLHRPDYEHTSVLQEAGPSTKQELMVHSKY